jgi:FtsZ-binding cell division protein ZapB
MDATRTHRFEKMEQLEAKVMRTIKSFADLNLRYQQLNERCEELQGQVRDLKRRNDGLTEEIAELRAMKEAQGDRALEDERILHKIDRMLEKFEELQI